MPSLPLLPTARLRPFYANPANPGANTALNWNPTYPDGIQWITDLRFQLATDANAANRQVALTTDIPGANCNLHAPAYIQTASLTIIYSFIIGWAPGTAIANGTYQCFPLSPAFFRLRGTSLTVSIANMQAGDAITNIQITGFILPENLIEWNI